MMGWLITLLVVAVIWKLELQAFEAVQLILFVFLLLVSAFPHER